jgi:hypothetical protein
VALKAPSCRRSSDRSKQDARCQRCAGWRRPCHFPNESASLETAAMKRSIELLGTDVASIIVRAHPRCSPGAPMINGI